MTADNQIPPNWIIAKFEELLDYIQPTEYIVESTEYDDNYKTPVLTAGKSFIKGYTNETNGIFNALPVIIFDDFTTATQFVNFPFKVKSSAMKILKPTSDLVNIKLAFYYMQTVHLKSETHKRYWISEYSKIPIPLAPLNEQKRILAKIEQLFTDLDKGIEYLKTTQQQLKVYRQAVLKWAFEGKLTNKNVVEGELPKGWCWKRLNEICKIIGGVTKGRDFKGKETIQLPYLRVANVQDGYLNLKEIKTIIAFPWDKEKYKLEYGDILYTEGGDKDKLGRGTLWKNEIKDCIHQNHIFRARPLSKDYDSKYIAYYSQSKLAKDYFFKNGKQTTNLASINLTILSNLLLPVCPTSEQTKIIKEIESRLSVCDKIEEIIETSLLQAEALRLSILKKAFEGKLVKQNPTDEPAQKLLEKIRSEMKNTAPKGRNTPTQGTALRLKNEKHSPEGA